jgi:hypothetical protein
MAGKAIIAIEMQKAAFDPDWRPALGYIKASQSQAIWVANEGGPT